MGEPAPRPAVYEDLLDLPENLVGETINGRLVTHPLPGPRHAYAASVLGAELIGLFDGANRGPDRWWILDKPELHLAAHVLVPEIAGWRRSRLPRLPDTAWFEVAPDWLCEVLSPSTAREDRVEKLPIYASFGVDDVWLIDPTLRTLEANENREGKRLLLAAFENDNQVSISPFDAIAFDLSGLWAD